MEIKCSIFVISVFLCVFPLTVVTKVLKLRPRIVNGKYSTWGQFPYYAHLETYSLENNTGLCGGSILSDRWILTAAHCIHDMERVIVHLGSIMRNDLMEPSRSVHTVNSKNFHIHKSYFTYGEIGVHDIGLIYLEYTVVFSATILPIVMPKSCNYFEYNHGVVMGFGIIDTTNNRLPELLKWMDIKTIAQNECEQLFPFVRKRYEISCAVGDGPGSICLGDSGSPLVRDPDGELLGVSHSVNYPNGCVPGTPQTFTLIHPYLKWISEETGLQLPMCDIRE